MYNFAMKSLWNLYWISLSSEERQWIEQDRGEKSAGFLENDLNVLGVFRMILKYGVDHVRKRRVCINIQIFLMLAVLLFKYWGFSIFSLSFKNGGLRFLTKNI